MTAPDDRTYHDPAAEASARAFEAAVDALDKAAYDCGADDSTTGVPKDVIRANHEKADTARAALIAAHAAAVADAYALGASVEREACTCACGEPLGELCYACNDDAREIEADPPALVNGGPPTDALDGGR